MSLTGSVARKWALTTRAVRALRHQVQVAPTTPLNRLRAIGFTDEQARALADGGYDVLGFRDIHALVGGTR